MLAEATTSPLHSGSAMVYELTTEQVLLEKNADEIAPLASPDAHGRSVSHKGGLRRASATVSTTKTHGSAARQPLKSARAPTHGAAAAVRSRSKPHRDSEVSRRLAEIPGIGPITANALVASIGDASCFSCGRQLAAWIGLVPRQHSSGGNQRCSASVSMVIPI